MRIREFMQPQGIDRTIARRDGARPHPLASDPNQDGDAPHPYDIHPVERPCLIA